MDRVLDLAERAYGGYEGLRYWAEWASFRSDLAVADAGDALANLSASAWHSVSRADPALALVVVGLFAAAAAIAFGVRGRRAVTAVRGERAASSRVAAEAAREVAFVAARGRFSRENEAYVYAESFMV